VSRPEPRRLLPLALALAASALAVGCGKSNLVDRATASSSAHPATPAASPSPAPAPETVPLPLKLTAARASAFARAVNLTEVDVPGSHRAPRTASLENRQEETAECRHGETPAIGGGRSAKLERGLEIDAESISSSVIVMPSPQAARTDLAYAESRAGLACYAMLVGRKLGRESNASVSIGHVRVARLSVVPAPGERASGIRISAEVSGTHGGLSLGLFVDAVAFQYGPAEVELYATSFVQPFPTATEQELLAVMRARARISPL